MDQKLVFKEEELYCPITKAAIKVRDGHELDRTSIMNLLIDTDLTILTDSTILDKRSHSWTYVKDTNGFKLSQNTSVQSLGTTSVDEKSVTDELDFATNWGRAFQKIYTEIKWLNAYAVINEIAAYKILKKFMKEHFKMKDNLIDKNIQIIKDDLAFVKRRNI